MEMKNTPVSTVLLLSGPSGVGKSKVLQALKQLVPDMVLAISHTARAPRPGETNGVEYYFVSEEQFHKMVEGNGFLEHHGHYGTSVQEVDRLAGMKPAPSLVVFEVDDHGGEALRRLHPQHIVWILLLPKSREQLKRQLYGRGTETEAEIQRRLAEGRRLVAKAASEVDFVVANDTPENAAKQILNLLRTRDNLPRNNQAWIDSLIED